MGKFYSAQYYFAKALPGFERTSTLVSKLEFYIQYADFYSKSGKGPAAVEYYTKAKSLADEMANLEWQQVISKELDSIYLRAGDYKQSHYYNSLYHQYNVQYMGITIGIAIVFLLLVLMGIFKVSEATIKTIGFFAFILLFEFIILLADAKIHHWTHGEPLPILGIKIVLIAMLLPLHHWLEHKVVSYLASRRLIIPSGKSLWKNISAKQKPAAH